MHSKVGKILYRMDTFTQHACKQATRQYNDKGKRKLAYDIRKVLKGHKVKQGTGLPSLLGCAFIEHLQKSSIVSQSYFSLPKAMFVQCDDEERRGSGPRITDFHSQLSTPLPQVERGVLPAAAPAAAPAVAAAAPAVAPVDVVECDESDGLSCDVAVDSGEAIPALAVLDSGMAADDACEDDNMMFDDPPAEHVYFSIVHQRPGKKRRLQVMPGAGASILQSDIAIAIHDVIGTHEVGGPIVSSRASKISCASLVSTCLLSDVACNFSVVSEHLLHHTLGPRSTMLYSLPGCSSSAWVALITDMVRARAFPGGREFVLADADGDRKARLAWLQRTSMAIATQPPDGPEGCSAWQFTEQGMCKLSAGSVLPASVYACEALTDRPPAKMSKYEMLKASRLLFI